MTMSGMALRVREGKDRNIDEMFLSKICRFSISSREEWALEAESDSSPQVLHRGVSTSAAFSSLDRCRGKLVKQSPFNRPRSQMSRTGMRKLLAFHSVAFSFRHHFCSSSVVRSDDVRENKTKNSAWPNPLDDVAQSSFAERYIVATAFHRAPPPRLLTIVVDS